MKRRDFLAGSVGAVGLGFGVTGTRATYSRQDKDDQTGQPFKLKYAPHFSMFKHRGKDLLDRLKFMHDQGFRALEDNWMGRRPVQLQERIAKEMQRLKMEMGVFVAHAEFRAVTFAGKGKKVRARIDKDIKAAVEVAKRVNARWCTVVPGKYDPRLEWDYQTANVVDNLRRAAAICEPSGLIMVIEALNPWRDHPGLFLTRIPQAYQICNAVNSASCKVLDDLYHQQITEGNLIPNIDKAWSQIAYFQTGDNPGRKEPGTGEINYRNVFKHIHKKGFDGIIGMEHGNSQKGEEGEMAVIRAYREADSF